MNIKIKNIVLGLAAALSLTSCQDVIQVDLDEVAPQLVIEGIVTDQPGPYTITITKTVAFDQPNDFPAVSAALVTIEDGEGMIDTLVENEPGQYRTQKLAQGVPGRTYTLRVQTEGQQYTAISKMPALVPMDKLSTSKLLFAGTPRINLVPEFMDPTGVVNFYNFTIWHKGVRQASIFTLSDELADGNRVTRPLVNPELELKSGDTCAVEMYCIDPAEFKYLLSLELTGGNGPGGGTIPANPDNNFGNACLGHFSAQTVQRREIVIP